jgi:Cytidylate kinase
MHDHQIDPHDAQAVAAALPQVRIHIRYGADGLQRMILNDEDVTDRIRLPEMSKFASAVSAIPAVRAFLLDMQRDLGQQAQCLHGRARHRFSRPPGTRT